MTLPEMPPAPRSDRSPAPAVDDRRRTPRRPSSAVAKLFVPGDRESLTGRSVTMLDLSLHGLGFQTAEALCIGHRYRLDLRGDWMNLSARIRIVTCRRREDGQYDVGAEFN